jgi:uncharacterized pyridoxamine 5'-phosphate oxidase family protein
MSYQLIRTAAWRFLDEQPHGTLVTLDSEGKPETAAIFFFVREDFSCFFVTKIGTRKYKNLAQNHTGVLFVYSDDELTSIELKGRLEIEHDTKEILASIVQFQTEVQSRSASYWVPPIAQIEAGEYVVCKLIPEVITFKP